MNITSIVNAPSDNWQPANLPGAVPGIIDMGQGSPSWWAKGWVSDRFDGDISAANAKKAAALAALGEFRQFNVWEDELTDVRLKNVRTLLKPFYDKKVITSVYGQVRWDDAYNKRVYAALSPYISEINVAYYLNDTSLTMDAAIAIAGIISAAHRLNSKKPISFTWRARQNSGQLFSDTEKTVREMLALVIACGVDRLVQWDDANDEATKTGAAVAARFGGTNN